MHFVWHLTSSLRWVVDAVSWRRTPCWLDRGLFGKKTFAAVSGTNGGFRSLGDLSLEKSTDFHNIYIYIYMCMKFADGQFHHSILPH